jgi:hypothetical protein
LVKLQYPIGRFEPPTVVDPARRTGWVDELEAFPRELRSIVTPLTESQLGTPYRPGGWTVRQVIHHVADSHANGLIRVKWTLTEDRPVIKAYFEERWAELADYRSVPIVVSLDLLDALHTRWVAVLRSLTEEQWRREFVHPESGPTRLEVHAGNYAWHGRHHMAHIRSLAERERW